VKILAIDPGSNLGWATDASGRLEFGTQDFRVKHGENSGARWQRFGAWLIEYSTQFPRLEYKHQPPEDSEAILRDIRNHERIGIVLPADCDLIFGRKVDAIVYEKSHFPSTARYAADIAAGFTTRLEEHCERHGIALHPVPVQTLKAFTIPKVKRKKGDPKMDRGKEAMIQAATVNMAAGWVSADPRIISGGLGADLLPTTLTEHEADALWLYWYAKEVLCQQV
jgi:hypothetical protein